MSEMTGENLKFILTLKPSDITLKFLKKYFASTKVDNVIDKKVFSFQDKFTLEKNSKFGNKENIRTNVGKYIFNLFTLEKFRGKVDYFNNTLNKSELNNINNILSEMILEDEITMIEYKEFIDRLNWLGFGTVTFTAPNFGIAGLTCPPKTAKLRKELFIKYKKELEDVDTKIVTMIENKLIASAKEELKGTTILDFYESGSRGNFDNNYKTMVLMKGLVPNPRKPGKFLVSLGNLSDGTPPEDQWLGANQLINGASGRALETAIGGYMAKQLNAAFQGIVLGEKDSNCKTNNTLTVTLTTKNINEFKYRFIIDGGNLVRLDKKNKGKYVGKTVKMRSPMYCKHPNICNKCFGDLPFILDIKNIGLTFSETAENLKLFSMKAFHDSSVKTLDVDIFSTITKL